MGVGICLIAAYLLFPEALSDSSESATDTTEVDICTYHSIGLNHSGMVSEQNTFCSLSRFQRGFGGLLSLMSINSTAALSWQQLCHPSVPRRPASHLSCTDPWGPPASDPGARHGPTSINTSAGFLRMNPSQATFLRKFWELEWEILMGNGF